MFVFVPHTPPSPDAVELGRRVAAAIRQHREENPNLSRADVRAGLNLADAEVRAEFGGSSPARLALLLGLVALLLGGLVAFYVAEQHGPWQPTPVFWTIAGIGFFAVIFAVKKLC